MNGENIIPKITDKRGMLWKQPHRRYIEIDESLILEMSSLLIVFHL